MATGFLSRILLIYGEPTGERITFPTDATQEVKEAIKKELQEIKQQVSGRARRIQKLIQCSMRFINNGKIYRIYDSGLIQAADYSTH